MDSPLKSSKTTTREYIFYFNVGKIRIIIFTSLDY